MRTALLAGLILVGACASGGSKKDDNGDPLGNIIGDWDANLSAVGSSNVTGSASAQSVGVGTGVRISSRGAQSGAHHPWHVHRGKCGDNGPIVGDPGAYPALHVGTDGNASAAATIDAALVEETAYSVNVHRSTADMGTVISCGALTND